MTESGFTPVAISLATGSLIWVLWSWHRRTSDLPPGPPKMPLIGNLLNMPRSIEPKAFAGLSQTYGSDMIHLEAFGTSLLVLNSYQVAEDLLDKKSSIYSSRPRVLMYEICGWMFNWIIWPYSERWRAARKTFINGFSSPNIHRPREVTYVNVLLRKLLEEPGNYFKHIRQLPGAITLDMTYGIKVKPENDPFTHLAETAAVEAAGIVGEPDLVEVLPFLRYMPGWFPGTSFQKRAIWSSALAHDFVNKPFEASQSFVKSGIFEPSLVTNALESMQKEGGDVELLKEVATTVYLAGSDTTTSVLGTFLLAMVLYPDVQKRIQDELDGILRGTLPRHEDLASFPYLEATLLEAIRWRPVLPLGVPHAIEADDIYRGYRIPAGTVVLPNQWAMLHDERDYPKPEVFDPNRFLKDGKLDRSVRSPYDIAFGFGRRVCPGQQIALSTLMYTTASVLSAFSFNKKKDQDGNPITPSGEYYGTTVSQPAEFPCEITPRSKQAIEAILALSDQ